MRLNLFVLLAVFAVSLNDAVSGSFIKLQNVVSTTATGVNSGRVLRTEPTSGGTNPDEEERGVLANIRDKLNQKALLWLKNKELAGAKKAKYKKIVEFVKTQDLSKNLDDTVQKLMKKGFNHDDVHNALKLSKEKNQWMSMKRDSPLYHKRSPEYKLWENLREAVLRQRANN
ncbi:Secreted RxLR effector peptide protein [Phytophthora palmivora]|uniref:Secreted RxLR effector peptide protein n=1 Tax=Phytophthora palmivora TaxID=4796 RepID=A0A2P4YQL1_9STRA|nr:Secreted RxLR effector peptide protein [Phytophthora palmivora]